MVKVSLAEMTLHDKLQLMEDLWADLSQHESVEPPAWHEAELAETRRRVAAGEEKFVDWADTKRQLNSKSK